ncbi:MAG: Asp-tRNA(Asn)/Glu-tRNA(Gln) amidotransferase GatCAB subunit A [Chloroflexi bacterium]|nr:Asp-tRNA(Asn)/Glu-tRNA(Gln) amidotransferase GatCAB subunit A [Chloroflexota bacterium]
MDKKHLPFTSIAQAAGAIRRRELSPVELVKAVLERTGRVESRLNAFITLLGDQALQDAHSAEAEIAAGQYRGPLHGIPVALKDIIMTRNVLTTCGSKALAEWVPDQDATIVGKLKEAGAIIVGKNNLHEFAAILPSQHFGPADNPWKPGHISGGSSSGSAVAVSAGQCIGAIGTDTGGSVRLPAAFCGVVGLLPTFGRVSHQGVVTLSWSMDNAGPLTRTVEDSAIMLTAISGFDSQDPVSADIPVPDFVTSLKSKLQGLRIGVPKDDYFLPSASPEVQQAFRSALSVLEDLGARVEEVTIPHGYLSTFVGDLLSRSEAGSFHRVLFSQRPSDYGPEIRLRILESRFFLAHHFIKAQRIRTLLVREIRQALSRADVIATPTTPETAPPRLPSGAPSRPILEPRYTRMWNMAGFPAISVPCGFDSQGLPIGLHLGGRAFDEATILRAAHAYERATSWHTRQPPVAAP